MRKLNIKIGDNLRDANMKKHFNEVMFTVISTNYDFITRLFSFWQDAKWKRGLIAALPAIAAPVCLDLACGTGDIAFLLAEKYPQGIVNGLDITEDMLVLARERNTYNNITFVNGDMGQLTTESGTVDVVTGGYALRNAPDLNVTIAEIYRVLKPGGTAAFLDFSKSETKYKQRLSYYILKGWTGMWGIILHRNHEVYSYIAESLDAYPDRKTLKQLFDQQGFTVLKSILHFFGITETLIVSKK